MRLFGREVRLQVDELLVHSQRAVDGGQAVQQGLDLRFEVERNLRREPNTAVVEIFNLNERNRRKLAELPATAIISLEAGYANNIGEIYKGTVRKAWSIRDGVDWITTVESGDGERSLRSSRIRQSFPAGTKVSTVLEKVAASLGIGLGELARRTMRQARFKVGDRTLGDEFVEGTVVSGNTADELTRLLGSVGLEWSVQGESIQVLQKDGALQTTAVVLNAASGLIGSPEVDSKGIVTFQALMNARIVPGQRVRIESEHLDDGFYGVQRAKYVGDTAGDDWQVEGEAKRA